MCGITGIARLDETSATDQDREIFLQLVQCGAVRGTHGTGLLNVFDNGSSKTLKIGGSPESLLSAPEFHKFWTDGIKGKVRFMVGHNRYGTTGDRTTDSAHPFRHGTITMVHNGTLDTDLSLPDYKKYKVDSEALCYSISKIGIVDTIKKTSGAYALVFYDSKEKTLNFLRNNDRPLALCFEEWTKRLIFASEMPMLQWIAGRNYIHSGKDVKFEELPINELWSFKMGNVEPTITKLMGKAPKIYTPRNQADVSGLDSLGTCFDPKTGEWSMVPAEITQEEIDKIDEELTNFEKKNFPGVKAARKAEEVKLPALINKPYRYNNPRLKEIYPNGHNYHHSDTIGMGSNETYKLLKSGDRFVVSIKDYVPEDTQTQLYVMIAEHDDLPNCRIQFRVTGNIRVDQMFHAAQVEVTMQNVLTPKKEFDETEIIIWVNEPIAQPNPPQKLLH